MSRKTTSDKARLTLRSRCISAALNKNGVNAHVHEAEAAIRELRVKPGPRSETFEGIMSRLKVQHAILINIGKVRYDSGEIRKLNNTKDKKVVKANGHTEEHPEEESEATPMRRIRIAAPPANHTNGPLSSTPEESTGAVSEETESFVEEPSGEEANVAEPNRKQKKPKEKLNFENPYDRCIIYARMCKYQCKKSLEVYGTSFMNSCLVEFLTALRPNVNEPNIKVDMDHLERMRGQLRNTILWNILRNSSAYPYLKRDITFPQMTKFQSKMFSDIDKVHKTINRENPVFKMSISHNIKHALAIAILEFFETTVPHLRRITDDAGKRTVSHKPFDAFVRIFFSAFKRDVSGICDDCKTALSHFDKATAEHKQYLKDVRDGVVPRAMKTPKLKVSRALRAPATAPRRRGKGLPIVVTQ